MITITTLIENLVYQRNLVAEHGLSFHISDGDMNILFDTGQGPNFIANAKQLGINLSDVDYLVISHGHFDHIGGLPDFLKINSKAIVILKRESLIPKFHGNNYIGFENPESLPKERITFLTQDMALSKNVFILNKIQNFYPIDNPKHGFYSKVNSSTMPDNFNDELFLVIKSDDKIHVLSCCSHNGITNIIETARTHFQMPVGTIVGGFHTKDSNPDTIEHITNYFNQIGIDVAAICHCTGVDKYLQFKEKCNAKIYYNHTGTQIKI